MLEPPFGLMETLITNSPLPHPGIVPRLSVRANYGSSDAPVTQIPETQ